MRVIRASGTEQNALSVRDNALRVQGFLLEIPPLFWRYFDRICANAQFLHSNILLVSDT